MDIVILILKVAAFVLFAIAFFGPAATARFNLIAGGLACWVLADLLEGQAAGVAGD